MWVAGATQPLWGNTQHESTMSEKVIFHYITLYAIIRAIRKFDDISDVTTP